MYTIGQVAKFLGVSRDTLKFYEEKGLVRPKQDEDNGYRRYNDHDIYDVITTNFYRQLDIEVKKIQEIRWQKSVDEMDQLLCDRRQRLEEEIAYKQRLLERIDEVHEGCQKIKQYQNQCDIREMGPLLVKGEITDFNAYEEYDMIRTNTEQLKDAITLTDVRRIISFDERGVTGNRCVVVNAIEQSEVAHREDVLYHPRCMYTIMEEGRGGQGVEDVAYQAEAYLRKVGGEKGYEPLGLVYINVLLTTYDKGLERNFLEIYVPIKN
ncbi:MAG: MerR family transcriptional regulator [Cellulosilyticaceae bacterium]